MRRDSPPHGERGESVDGYDVTTWEPRTRLDRFSVALEGLLRAHVGDFLVALSLLLLLVQLVLGGFVLLREPGLDVLTVLSIVPAFLLFAGIWALDPTGHEPLRPVAITFLLGVLFAGFAALLNTALRPGFQLLPIVGLGLFFFLVVGPLEESVKVLAVRVGAYRSPSFDSVIDGMVYGAAAGLGFATIENSVYITREFLAVAQPGSVIATPDQVRAAIATAAQRSFVGPGHVLYSSISGYYLGLAKFNPERFGPIVLKGVLIAAFAHAVYDAIAGYAGLAGLAFVVYVVLFDGVVLAYLYRKLTRYRRVAAPASGSEGSGA
ncbi:MAG: PrsW family intramembrane metalloprotease [Haloarculaceae archaeon]